jgi:hypothetical protein
LFDVGVLAETGFAAGRGSVLLGGRYSYTAAAVSLLAPEVDLAYRDYQVRVSYELTPDDRLTAFGFGAYDLLAETDNGIYTVVFGTEFYRLDLRYDHSFAPESQLRTAITLGFDQTHLEEQGQNARDRLLSLRSELYHPLAPSLTVRGGADVTLDAFSRTGGNQYIDPDDPDVDFDFNELFPTRTDLAFGAWTDLVWNPLRHVEVTPGARVDLFASGGQTALAVDPRVAARFEITDRLRITHAYGLAHQPPSFVVPLPGLTPGKLSGGLQTSFQTSAGVELDLFESTTATATLFHNAFFNMNDALGAPDTSGGGSDEDEDEIAAALDQRSRGTSQGFELFVRRRLTQRLGGYLSYTLSRSTRTAGRHSFPSAFDRTHVGSTALAYDLGRNWRAGTRFVFYTGIPKEQPFIVIGENLIRPAPLEHPERDPPFYRLDVRLEKRWTLGESTWISFVLEVLNATLQKETFGESQVGPVTIPSIGLEAGF